jgi:uncharacterized protein (TIGR02246 family)
MSQDEAQIKAAVRGFPEAWLSNDSEAVVQLWDLEAADSLTFVVVESDTFILGPAAIRGYFHEMTRFVTLKAYEMSDPLVRFLSNDTAYTLCTFDWTYELGGKVLTSRARATILLRKRAGQWRYQHMHESVSVAPQV